MNLLAGIFAVLFPGAGHFFIHRQKRRGVLAAVGVLGLFFGGMFIGGIDVIDREEDKYWFLGQALTGPLAFVVNAVHQNSYKAFDIPPEIVESRQMDEKIATSFHKRSLYPHEQRQWIVFTIKSPTGQVERTLPVANRAGAEGGPPNQKSIGRMNELGMLSATLGGMLNFIILLDALFPTRRKEDS